MAVDNLYIIALNNGTNAGGLYYSSDGGSSWSELITGFCSLPEAGSLFALDDTIYFTCSKYTDNTAGYIGYHTHGGVSPTAINVKSILGLTSGNWQIGPIRALSPTDIYFTAHKETVTKSVRLYRFNGSWSSPVAGDFTLLGSISNYGMVRGMYVESASSIYLTSRYTGSYGSNHKSLLYYNGSTLSADSSFPWNTLEGGIALYNGEIYVYGHGDDSGSGTWKGIVWKGSYGSWVEQSRFAITNHYFPLIASGCDGALGIDGNGYFHANSSDGGSGGYARLYTYNGSWSNQIIGALGTGGTQDSVFALGTDQILTYEGGTVHEFDNVSLNSYNPSEFGTINAIMAYNTAPSIDSWPGSPNASYYKSKPLTWSTSDDSGPVSIVSLTINSIPVIVNDVIQSNFAGTLTANGSNGIDISILARSDIFRTSGLLSWYLEISDGILTTTATGQVRKFADIPMGKFTSKLSDDKDYEVDSGNLATDETIMTRVRFRLTCHRGKWPIDKNIGSKLHEIKTLRDAERKTESYVNEALKDMIDDGDILKVEIVDFWQDPETGSLAANLLIYVDENQQEQLRHVFAS